MTTDIVQRLSFDATRCELQFSKGVATNIEEAAAEIERLRADIKWKHSALFNAKDYILSHGSDDDMAPLIEQIERAMATTAGIP